MNPTNQSLSDSGPLGELVASQLKAIVHCEEQLQRRYGSLVKAPSLDDAQAWASEVWRLRLRADRLARMLDALEGNYAGAGCC
jgi:hypothetical protein